MLLMDEKRYRGHPAGFYIQIFKGEKEEISEGVGIFITCLDIAAWGACMA